MGALAILLTSMQRSPYVHRHWIFPSGHEAHGRLLDFGSGILSFPIAFAVDRIQPFQGPRARIRAHSIDARSP